MPAMPEHRHLQVTKHGDVFVLRFVDQKLVDSLAIEIGEELFSVADQKDCKNVLLNFSGVDHLCSAILGKLLSLNRRMNRKGGKLRACEIAPSLRSVFTWTVLDTTETEAKGLRAFA